MGQGEDSAQMRGKLIVCPTPLGNLGDVTARTEDALRTSDVVCAEDTRVTGKLLAALGIEKRLERLDEAALSERAAFVIERVLAGQVIAYCSDAGMPGVSDPGLRLVRAARTADAAVEVLPGPSAVTTAYVASGCINPRFFFGGFFPRKPTERRVLLESLRSLDAALVFYESPNRLVSALGALAEAFPERELAVCRELTKLHEEVVRGQAAEVHGMFAERERAGGVRGEIVIVVDGPCAAEDAEAAALAENAARKRAVQLAAEGLRSKQIAKALAAELGISRNAAYDIALAVCTGKDASAPVRPSAETPSGSAPSDSSAPSGSCIPLPATRKTVRKPAQSGAPLAKSRKTVVVDGLSVLVARKRIKNLNMRVKAPDGHVEVSAPPRVSEERIAAFVREKRAWIERRRTEIAASPAKRAAEALPEEVAQWRAVVEALVPVLVGKWEPVMGVRAGKLAYRNMTSRWGSCQPSTGRICINVRLALYPPECLEYVVVHELCHLIERGHGPKFQAAMTRFLPDWKQRRAKLR